jgi:hypothetical protein
MARLSRVGDQVLQSNNKALTGCQRIGHIHMPSCFDVGERWP